MEKLAENRECGTWLDDAFNIIYQAPQERILSLTYKLGSSQEEELVHAMSLIKLRRAPEARNKCLKLKSSSAIATYLSETITLNENWVEHFRLSSASLPGSKVDALVELARIFKVLVEERLCDVALRDQAYCRALQACGQEKGPGEAFGNTPMEWLKEEAKRVCGPHIGEISQWPFSQSEGHLKSISASGHRGSFSPASGRKDALSLPSSLRTADSSASFPSQLEISLPYNTNHPVPFSTCSSPANQSPISLNTSSSFSSCHSVKILKGSSASLLPEEVGKSMNHKPLGETSPPSMPIELPVGTKSVEAFADPGIEKTTGHKSTNVQIASAQERYQYSEQPKHNFSGAVPSPSTSNHKPDNQETESEEEEEDTFFTFVILHAEEDTDLAEQLSLQLESLNIGVGTTFSQCEIPGKSIFTCLEDAINNSAYTILLLTQNYNRLLDTKTNLALINSLEKGQKHHTVIPLLPIKNRLARENMPLILRQYSALEEGLHFERKVKKTFLPQRIEEQKRMWKKQQQIKYQLKRKERLEVEKRLNQDLVRRNFEAKLLEKENLQTEFLLNQMKYMQCPSPGTISPPRMPPLPQSFVGQPTFLPNFFPQSNIHIENASYIMIGNDSTMTVGTSEITPGDEDSLVDEEEDFQGTHKNK